MEKAIIKKRKNRRLEDWRETIDKLESQMKHNFEEARNSFEKQKENLASWAEKVGNDIEQWDDLGEDKAKTLKSRLEALRVQAALGRAEADDLFHQRQKDLNLALHNARLSFDKLVESSSDKLHTFLEKSDYTLDEFRTSFDLFRLQLNLGKKDATQNWQERKKEITTRLNKLKININKAQENSSERWEHFSEEIVEAWSHLKKAVG